MNCLVSSFTGVALFLAAFVNAQADPAAGQKVFTANSCQYCHYTEGPAREKTIADQMSKKGPELWYAGSKFQLDWLESWLADPKPIRLMKYNSLTEENPGDHPKLGAADAASVSEFLGSLMSEAVTAGSVPPKNTPKGRLIFRKKMPCSGCHQFPDRTSVAGGKTGPSLVGAGARLNPDWILAYLQKPEVFKPVKPMPVFVGLLTDRDMQAVSSYVASFK